MPGFRYDDELLAVFPTTRGGVIHAVGLDNTSTSAVLTDRFRDEQAKVKVDLGDTPLSELASISAWRSAFSRFGVKPTQYRSAAEALLRRLTKPGDIPSINLLVDIANLVSIRHHLPVAVFDQSAVIGVTTVRFAGGTERFTDLGSDVVSNPEAGEVIFVDEAGMVSARRWCWRQSIQSAARSDTTEALITVEGHHDDAQQDVAAALEDLLGLLALYQPGSTVGFDLLAPGHPEFQAGPSTLMTGGP
jgi:DNA/RNA-binding domain of Phe-tRNA-synthetase-like protein